MFKNFERKVLIFSILISVLFIIIVVGFYLYKFHNGLSDDQSIWGALGDYFGGIINPFFSFLSFILLLNAFLLQNKELRMTSNDLLESKKIAQEQLNIIKKDYKRDEIFKIIFNIDERMDKMTMTVYIIQQVQDKQKNTSSRNIFEYEMLLEELYNLIQELVKIDNDSVIIYHYKIKYSSKVKAMFKKGYLNNQINDFF